MRRLTIGLTGSLGAGKSTALDELARLGAAVVSADQVARELSGPGGAVSRAVARLFGRGYLAVGGAVDREALAQLVFGQASARRRLERATHPLILREMRRRLARARGSVAVADVPLLFEAGLAKEFDVTVAVSAPREASLARVGRRDGMARAEALRRRAAQWPDARKAAAADVVWRNAGPKDDLLKQVRRHYRAWRLIAGSAAAS